METGLEANVALQHYQQPTTDSTALQQASVADCCEVCLLIVPQTGLALVLCGHARFCAF